MFFSACFHSFHGRIVKKSLSNCSYSLMIEASTSSTSWRVPYEYQWQGKNTGPADLSLSYWSMVFIPFHTCQNKICDGLLRFDTVIFLNQIVLSFQTQRLTSFWRETARNSYTAHYIVHVWMPNILGLEHQLIIITLILEKWWWNYWNGMLWDEAHFPSFSS